MVMEVSGAQLAKKREYSLMEVSSCSFPTQNGNAASTPRHRPPQLDLELLSLKSSESYTSLKDLLPSSSFAAVQSPTPNSAAAFSGYEISSATASSSKPPGPTSRPCPPLPAHPNNLDLKNVNVISPRTISEPCDEEAEGVQSKERWTYVKVNMDGIVIGRKVCVLDHSGYSSLAFQLEDMFGRQSVSGLRLFQVGSEFVLFCKDRDDNWRTVGDVPWREFVECVKRPRIARKN